MSHAMCMILDVYRRIVFAHSPPRASHARKTFGFALAALALIGLSLMGPAARAAQASHSWSMDEAPGTGTMFDAGLPAANGNWLNIQAGVPGFAGTAYRFDGTSRVTVPDAASLDPGSDTFTVTAHVKFTAMPTDAVGGDYDLIRKGLGSTSGGYWKIEIYPNKAHTKALGLCQMKGSSNHIKITGSPVSLNNGQWHTLSCTKTNSDVTLTVDGTNYRKSVTIGSIANSDPLTIGADKTQDDVYSGDLDEVAYQIGGGSPSAPSVTGFSPPSGPIGTSVTISGSNFTGANDVRFQGTSVGSGNFTVDSDAQITATVPSGATTGPIAVVGPGGTGTSASNFAVTGNPPPGTISEVQSKKASANALSISATLGSPPTPGNVLVAVVVVPQAASPGFALPAGWTAPFTPARGAVFWKASDGSEQAVTVNLSSGETAKALRMWVVELSGVDTGNAFDQSGSAILGSVTSSVTPVTAGPTAQADEWAIAAVAHNGDNGGGASATGGFAVLAPDSRAIAATKVLNTAGTVSTTVSWTTPRAGSWLIATFRAA